MAARASRAIVLASLLVMALAAVVVYRWRGEPVGPAGSLGSRGTPAAGARNASGKTPANGAGQAVKSPVPEVALDALQAPRPEPLSAERNPFRFQAKASESGPSLPARPGAPVPSGAENPLAAPQPPPAPIPLKFIGVVEAAEQAGKLAVLSDGRDVYFGREGDVIDGRYRIVRISVESIDMAYADGRGRQTIRLSGG